MYPDQDKPPPQKKKIIKEYFGLLNIINVILILDVHEVGSPTEKDATVHIMHQILQQAGSNYIEGIFLLQPKRI